MRNALVLSSLMILSCGSPAPANVAGTYAINLTNGANGCNYGGWTANGMLTASVAITQNGTSAQGVVQGAVGAYLDLTFGSHIFNGTVEGDSIGMTLQGAKGGQMGNCVYTVTATFAATSNGDFLTGTIDYTDATNHNSDCTTLQGCHSTQQFNGSRPPQ